MPEENKVKKENIKAIPIPLKLDKKMLPLITVIFIFLFALFFSGLFTFKPVSGEILEKGTKVIESENDGELIYRVEGDFEKKRDYLVGIRFTATVNEEYLDHSYEIGVTLPRLLNKTGKLEGCNVIELKFKKLLGPLHVFKSAENLSSCDVYSSAVDYNALEEELYEKIELVADESADDTFTISLRCEGADCVHMDTMEEPYSWYRLAQYSHNKENDGFSADKYLSDMTEFDAEAFNWRVFQYGQIVTHDEQTIKEYGEDYINIVNGVYDESMFSAKMDSEDIDVWTTDNHPSEETTENYKAQFEGNSLGGAVNKGAADVAAFALAYKVTGDPKYIGISNYILWQSHIMNYIQDDVQSPRDIEFKQSTCNLVFAEAMMYNATKDDKYLEYVDYLIEKGTLKEIYSELSVSDVDKGVYTPMFYIPCMVGLEILGQELPEKREGYYEVADIMYDYVIDNHLIELAKGTEGYPLLVGMDFIQMEVFKYYDVTSSCWFLYSLSMKNNRDE